MMNRRRHNARQVEGSREKEQRRVCRYPHPGRRVFRKRIQISPGGTAYEEMIRGTRAGLLVHSVMGQGNPFSGELSVNVSLGYKIESGEIVGRVRDVMLAENVYDALKDMATIGDTPEWVSGSWTTIQACAPPIMIGRPSVVAK